MGTYRYGFNGKEKDKDGEWGGLTHYDYGFRIYNPAIGKFLSVDPLTKSYPFYTPYQFAGNKPVWAMDIDGLEELIYQYTLKNGKATLLNIINNGEVRYITFEATAIEDPVLYDKRTGKPMVPSEVGKVQYQYYDVNGERLNIRKNYKGEYVEGENELMDIGANNLFGSIYIGPTNPELEVDGKKEPDYRREPQDEVDAGAYLHDLAYGNEGAAGLEGALYDEDVRPADEDLIGACEEVLKKKEKGEKDTVTGNPITGKTAFRAKAVKAFFKAILHTTKREKRETKYPKREDDGSRLPIIKY